jgi:amino acid adenylation domain-containing protein
MIDLDDQTVSVASLIEREAAAHPARIAVMCGDRGLDYATLNGSANRLARHLIALGVRPGDRVALAVERGLDMVVAILAILKAGGAYVPIDPAYPEERIAFMLADSQPCLVVTQARPAVAIAALAGDVPMVSLDDGQAAWDGLDASDPDPSLLGLADTDLAYVIYTSGSTGTPKGVMVEHRQMVWSTRARLARYPGADRALLLVSIAFDGSVASLFGTLAAGGSLIIPRPSMLPDLLDIIDRIDECEVESLICGPSLLGALLDVHDEGSAGSLRSLRRIVVGGEACPRGLVGRVADALPDVEMHNEYGPTECAVWATAHRCDPREPGIMMPIGRPVAGAVVLVLNEDGGWAAPGELGELFIGGAGVARGYLGRAALTAERFVRVASSDHDGILYRTGDLGRRRADGAIEFLGRADEQIKVNGFRIEPGEIEAALLRIEAVREAAVLGEGNRLVAYVVGRHGAPSWAAVGAALTRTLPSHLLPSAYVQVEAMPKLPNGKLDRRALAAMRGAPGPQAGPAPRSADERLLCEAFARVTGAGAVGLETDFFEAGGDSLAAMILVTVLRQRGRELDLALLYAHRTPGRIALAWSSDEPAMVLPVLFMIPGSGGDEPALASLRTDWAGKFEPVVLGYPDWAAMTSPAFTMDDMVLHFTRQIAKRRRGKLLMTGYSLGGSMAWAIASRLASAGDPVAVLALLDADLELPTAPVHGPPALRRAFRQIGGFARAVLSGDRKEANRIAGEVVAYRLVDRPRLLRVLMRFRGCRLPSGLRFRVHVALAGELQTRIVRAWFENGPKPVLSLTRVVLFRARRRPACEAGDADLRTRCALYEVIDVEGDHRSLLDARGDGSLRARLPAAFADYAVAR